MRVSPSIALAVAAAVILPAAGCGGGAPGNGRPSGAARSENNGRAPQPSASARSAWIPGYISEMSLEEKVGQLFVPAFSGPTEAKTMIRRFHIGGLIYFPANFAGGPAATAKLSNTLQGASKLPLLLSVDEEQGLVSRAPFLTRFPGNMALGATRRPADARAAAWVTGTELRAVGINQDYAPVADVNLDPANPVIGIRSFGADPTLVAQMVPAAIAGYQAAGIAATTKHFPGHGDTGTDSHTGLPVIQHTRAEWERLDAPPFQAAVRSGVDAIMSAHIVVPGLDRTGVPATFSKPVLTGLLRQQVGHQGVIVTDSLRMQGARIRYSDASVPVRAVNAGADQLLMPPRLSVAYGAVLRAVRNGTITRQRLDDAVGRILRLKERRGLFRAGTADPRRAKAVVRSAANQATAEQVAERAVTLVRNNGGLLPLRDRTVYVTGPEGDALVTALRRTGVRTTGSPSAADAVVLTTLNAGSFTAPRIRALSAKSAKPVVVVALGRPYDLDRAGRATATLATYSPGGAAIRAAAKVIAGVVKPTGRLPVRAGGMPVGHGLTYP